MYYFGARYYDPEIGVFTSTDPMEEFWNSYSYTGGNPVNLIDPSGLSTCADETGNVTEVRNDGDLHVYTWTQESGNDIAIGKTDFWNEFKSSDFINIGMSVDATIMKMQYKYVVGMNALEVALESKGKGVLDVKTQGLSPKEGYLYQGSYMTGRSVGNRLARINAAALKMPWRLSNLSAGVLHLKENLLSDLGKPSPYGNTLRYMGEIDYTGRQFQMGYNSVRK